MAIDTRAKRQAVAVIATPWMAVGITPDATPDQFWRQTAGWGYGGILAGEEQAAQGGNMLLLGVGSYALWFGLWTAI